MAKRNLVWIYIVICYITYTQVWNQEKHKRCFQIPDTTRRETGYITDKLSAISVVLSIYEELCTYKGYWAKGITEYDDSASHYVFILHVSNITTKSILPRTILCELQPVSIGHTRRGMNFKSNNEVSIAYLITLNFLILLWS